MNIKQKNTHKSTAALLAGLVTLKALALVVVFSVLHPGLSWDAAEILYWTQELQWSGQKHPAMPAWILKSFLSFLPDTLSSYYLVGQATLVLTYLFVWLLAKEFLAPLSALLATLVLSCGLFYSFYSLTYNANTVSLLSWAAFNFFLWKSLDDGRFRWWIALAFAAAVALLTKYAAGLLFFAAGVTILLRYEWRACLKTYKPYAAAALLVALTLPHWWWVMDNDYPTFGYASAQLSQQKESPFFLALYYPLRFTYGQIVNMLPVLLCFAVFLVPSRTRRLQSQEQEIPSSYDKKVFLLTMGLLPYVVTVFLAAVFQKFMHSLWGLFYWNLAGISLFYFLRKRITQEVIARRVRFFFAVWTFVVFLTTAGFLASVGFPAFWERGKQEQGVQEGSSEKGSLTRIITRYRPWFDAGFVAKTISERRQKQGFAKLSVIGGEQWLATNVAFFSKSRLSVVTLFDDKKTAWLARNREQWDEEGGVLLWLARDGRRKMPLHYRRALGNRSYVVQESFFVPWQKVSMLGTNMMRGVPMPRIGWAIVPPLQKKE